jgi:aryl-alcohol dehydrogenase-like predicted oxidoreductase
MTRHNLSRLLLTNVVINSLYGDSEELIGKWFKRTGKRNDIFLATKFGFLKDSGSAYAVDSSAEYCKKACAESLRHLDVDYIDLCKYLISPLAHCVLQTYPFADYMHHANPKTPIEETVRAMAELKA